MHSLGEGLPTLRATSVQGPFLQRGSLPAAAWEAGLAWGWHSDPAGPQPRHS